MHGKMHGKCRIRGWQSSMSITNSEPRDERSTTSAAALVLLFTESSHLREPAIHSTTEKAVKTEFRGLIPGSLGSMTARGQEIGDRVGESWCGIYRPWTVTVTSHFEKGKVGKKRVGQELFRPTKSRLQAPGPQAAALNDSTFQRMRQAHTGHITTTTISYTISSSACTNRLPASEEHPAAPWWPRLLNPGPQTP